MLSNVYIERIAIDFAFRSLIVWGGDYFQWKMTGSKLGSFLRPRSMLLMLVRSFDIPGNFAFFIFVLIRSWALNNCVMLSTCVDIICSASNSSAWSSVYDWVLM